jgi:capsular polysaccharide transport system permease protein
MTDIGESVATLNSTGEFASRSNAISVELRRVARRARIPRPVNSGGRGFRARRSDKFYRAFFIGSFLLFFIVPVGLSGIYYFAMASDQYVSEARFAVRAGEESGLEALASVASILNIGQSSDGQIIAEYAKSPGIIQELQKSVDLRRVFNPGTWDVYAEAPADMKAEAFVKYWNNQVSMKVDRTSGLVTLRVRTFSPADSLIVAQNILKVSERQVNELTRSTEANGLNEALRELNYAKQRLESAVAAMRDARVAAGILDVSLAANTYSDVMTSLYTELSGVDTQISSLRENKASDAPQLVALEAKAKSLRDQIAVFAQKMAGGSMNGSGQTNLAQQAGELADKQIELSIAQNEYKLSVANYEGLRLNSERQRAYILTYVQPSLAQDSLYPNRGVMFAVVAAVCFLFWAIAVGLAISVRDHMAG